MIWNKHYDLVGTHAFLSASKHHWTNYDDDKFLDVYAKHRAAQRGTELHDFASNAIRLGIKLPRANKTLNLYVNDGIGFKMRPEVTLFYSFNCYGTADAIAFRNKVLRIHDLKTGTVGASMRQLEIYAALFCLEYKEDPNNIGCELRIYQSDQVLVHDPAPEDLLYIMQKIKTFDDRIQELQREE